MFLKCAQRLWSVLFLFLGMLGPVYDLVYGQVCK